MTLPPIVYEDDWLVAFDKPSGLLVAPDRWDKDLPNLMGMIHAHLSPRYFNVHRIDRDTSGILLCAKTKEALDAACRQFEARQARKEYLAITRNAPAADRGLVAAPIAADHQRPGRMRLVAQGKPCETEYEVLDRFRRHALVRAVPLTGRTHQIRIHLASLQAPIVADPFYGGGRGLLLSELKRKYKFKDDQPEKPLIGRLALHAELLTMAHPATGQPVSIRAPLPKDFEIAVKYLKRFGT